MRYRFTRHPDCLRAELVERESVAETVDFIEALVAEAEMARCPRVMVHVRRSRPIFTIEKYGISAYLKQIAAVPEARIALVADEPDVHAAHQYIEVIAQQRKANVRAFRDEAQALAWLSVPGETVEKSPAARGPGLGAD